MLCCMADGHPGTNKTEFQRYLDEHGAEIPSLSKMHDAYLALPCQRSQRFGFWLRSHRYDRFCKAYNHWWLRHPELFGVIYAAESTTT